MKKFLRTSSLAALCLFAHSVHAQCVTTNLNWDYLDFNDPSFTQNTLAICQTQKFAFGTQALTITNNYTSANILGENTSSTSEAGTYGTGADVQFMGNGVITVTFQNAVTNTKFSVYDVDYSQVVTVTALNGATPVNVNMAKVSGSILTIANNGLTNPSATASANAAATSSTDGAINVDIINAITSFTITVTATGVKTTGPAGDREDGSFWISDIQACSVGSFPVNDRLVSQPWTGMPSYVLAVNNNKVYYVDPVTGKARFLFRDAGNNNINSVAYDPVNKFVYYTYSLTGSAANDKILRRYDYNTDTMGIVMNDVSVLGFPLYDNGVESGAASFYNNSLYLGIEGNGTNSTGGRESKIYKIDFNGSHFPIAASQVYGIDGTGHDWGDFGVTNGTLYDFDADAGNENLYVVPLISRATTIAVSPAAPKQTSIDWQENLFNIGNTGSSPSTGFIATYTSAGVQGTQTIITVNGVAETGSWGDGAEAFKPKADFGDAPASFDPDPTSPALHEKDTSLRLGAAESIEWNKTASTNADADTDEDGLPFVRILTSAGNYYTDLDVYNNSGANATVCAWIDFNGNGVFETSEGVSQTVTSAAATQRIQLLWPAVVTTLTDNSNTFIRIRVTSATNNMTTANPTGYFYNGEVEDYYVVVNSIPLDVKLTQFTVSKINEQKVNIFWTVDDEERGTDYEIQRSTNGTTWQTIDQQIAEDDIGLVTYHFSDLSPVRPVSHYRLKYTDIRNKIHYSRVQKVQFSSVHSFKIYPNPVVDKATLHIESLIQDNGYLQITDMQGKIVHEEKAVILIGHNTFSLPTYNLEAGVYNVRLSFSKEMFNNKLFVVKN